MQLPPLITLAAQTVAAVCGRPDNKATSVCAMTVEHVEISSSASQLLVQSR